MLQKNRKMLHHEENLKLQLHFWLLQSAHTSDTFTTFTNVYVECPVQVVTTKKKKKDNVRQRAH